MATIYADFSGALLRVLGSPDEESRYPDPPPGTTQTVSFDETTNAAVIAGLRTDWDAFRVVGGVLQRKGSPVSLAADSPTRADRAFVRTNLTTVLSALRSGTATPAQLQRVLAFLLSQATNTP